MKSELFDLVLNAQKGDHEALNEIIESLLPAIKSTRNKTKYENREDLEQDIVAILIHKILSYDLTKVPDFSTFFKEYGEEDSIFDEMKD